jgi:WXXGXW repeat (2 copies)
MKKTRWVSLLLGLIVVASVAPSAEADRWGGRGKERREDRREDKREDRRDDRRDDRREQRREDRRERRERANRAPPAMRVERHDNRRGYAWVDGGWNWDGYDWQWTAGRYERERRGRRWRPVSWELRGGDYVSVGGDWVVTEPTMAPPTIREERFDRRPGQLFVRGHYDWRDGEWAWVAGHYERERAGYRYEEPRYEQRNGVYVSVGGSWVVQ